MAFSSSRPEFQLEYASSYQLGIQDGELSGDFLSLIFFVCMCACVHTRVWCVCSLIAFFNHFFNVLFIPQPIPLVGKYEP